MQILKYDSLDLDIAIYATKLCDLHMPAIEALILAGDNDSAYRKLVGLATYYHPRIYELLATFYLQRRNLTKYWPALLMSGAWSRQNNFLVHEWIRKHSKNGPAQLRSRFPTCFRSRAARPLMPLHVAKLLFKSDFFVFPKRKLHRS